MTTPQIRLFAAFFVLATLCTPAHALIAFGPPAPLNSTAFTDTESVDDDDVDVEVSLANDGATNWVALWSSDNSLGGTLGGDSDIFVATSSDDGETWSAAGAAMAAASTDGTASDSAPSVAHGNGVFVGVFSSDSTLGETVGNDRDVLFTRSTDSGATWSAPALLNSGGLADDSFELDGQASIATDGTGNWVVVWQHNTLGGMNPTGFRVYFSYSTDDGQTWAAQQPLGGLQAGIGIGNGQGTAVAWNGASFVTAWGSSEDLGSNGSDGDILYSVIAVPAFTASAPLLLHTSGTTDGSTDADQYPAMLADGSTVIAAWTSKADVGGTGADRDILFARSTDGGSTWSAASALSANATSDVGDDNFVALAHDGTTFLAVWDSNDPLGKLAKSDFDILMSRSDDGGVTWTDALPLATTAAKDKGADVEPAIAANVTTGTWSAAWQSTDTQSKTIGGDRDILAVYSAADCPAAPVSSASCIESTVMGGASLIVQEKGAKDAFKWKLAKGDAVDKAADIGSPESTDDYVLCIYDETASVPELVVEVDIESGGNCYAKPCWADKGTKVLYKHKAGIATGASLAAGEIGKSKIQVKGKGGFQAPALPFSQDSSVSVRLHNLGNGKCFAADFSTSSSNTAALYKAKSN